MVATATELKASIYNKPSTLGKRPLQGTTRSQRARKRIGTYLKETLTKVKDCTWALMPSQWRGGAWKWTAEDCKAPAGQARHEGEEEGPITRQIKRAKSAALAFKVSSNVAMTPINAILTPINAILTQF